MEGLEQQAGLKPISVEFRSTTNNSLVSLPLSSATTTESTGLQDDESDSINTEPTGHEDPETSITGHEEPSNSTGSRSTISDDDTNDNFTEEILYLLMKYYVSMQFYHYLSRLSDHGDLP